MEPTILEPLINYGVLGILVGFLLFGIWKIAKHGGAKAVELGERYVTSTEKLHDSLHGAGEQQRQLCTRHAETLVDLNETMQRQTGIAECAHLNALVTLHGTDWQGTMKVVHENNKELKRVKGTLIEHCKMCRLVAHSKFPELAHEIDRHCGEIERIIGEA